MSARYWVLVWESLLDNDATWPDGLRLIKRAEPHGPLAVYCLFEDDNAPPEMNGKEVELVIGLETAADGTQKPVIAERDVLGDRSESRAYQQDRQP